MPPALMLFAVDIGNTALKIGCFRSDAATAAALDGVLVLSTRDTSTWKLLENLPPQQARWRIGSVHREAEIQLAKWVAHHRPQDDYQRLENRDLPLSIEVDFPDRVGIDRLLAAVAVNGLRIAERPAIVVDAGTAVTVDLIAASGAFQGGVIWPGWRMMAATLASHTDALPLVTAAVEDGPPPVVGRSTEKAIRSGLYWGNVGAIREFLAQMQAAQTTSAQVFVTGGDAERFVERVCASAVRVRELVLQGIAMVAAAERGP